MNPLTRVRVRVRARIRVTAVGATLVCTMKPYLSVDWVMVMFRVGQGQGHWLDLG